MDHCVGVDVRMVDLVRTGRDPEELAREFEPTAQSIRTWVADAERSEGRREEAVPGLAAAERDELVRLRRRNRQLRVERDILSEAPAWFAREAGTIPSNPSGSCARTPNQEVRRTRPISRLQP